MDSTRYSGSISDAFSRKWTNETLETLEFTEIPGNIPNRGLGLLHQADINLHGLTYLQQVQDANVRGPNGKPAGIHIEPRYDQHSFDHQPAGSAHGSAGWRTFRTGPRWLPRGPH